MIDNDTNDAIETLGTGYDHPSVEIQAPRTAIERRGRQMVEVDYPAFVKISTSFKGELKDVDSDALKVWLYIALSINRNTETAYPGLRKIAEETSLAINTVRAAVDRLENQYNLLNVTRDGTRKTIYRTADYVSANARKTVSPADTVSPETVSNSGETVSKNAQTVSASRQENAQPENQNNHIAPAIEKSLSTMPIDWQLSHNVAITEKDLQGAQLIKAATDSFERELGFGPLDWFTRSEWEKLRRFVVRVYTADPAVFVDFAAWRKDKGKYKGWTNAKIRTTPQVFIDGALPEFEASKMYSSSPYEKKAFAL